jgi:hypothetical protein
MATLGPRSFVPPPVTASCAQEIYHCGVDPGLWMARDWILSRYSPFGMQLGILKVYFAVSYVSCATQTRDEGWSLPLKSHVPPGNFGPISKILNHTSPDPSKASAVVGAFAIYTLTGPSWYTGVSVPNVTELPAFTEPVVVFPATVFPTAILLINSHILGGWKSGEADHCISNLWSQALFGVSTGLAIQVESFLLRTGELVYTFLI